MYGSQWDLRNLLGGKLKSGESFSTLSASVPRAGIEPAHLAVLVFETNASTYSAIWAYLRVQRYGIFSETPNN